MECHGAGDLGGGKACFQTLKKRPQRGLFHRDSNLTLLLNRGYFCGGFSSNGHFCADQAGHDGEEYERYELLHNTTPKNYLKV